METNFKECEEFFKAKSGLSKLTIDNYNRTIFKFLVALSVDNIETFRSIKASEIRSYIGTLNGVSAKNSAIRILKAFYSWMFQNDKIETNEMLKVKKEKEPTKVVRMPTVEEMEYLFQNCDNQVTHLILTLGSRVGLRREEMTKIQIQDIDFNTGRLLVHGKGNKEASLKLADTVITEIRNYIDVKDRVASEYLFSYNGDKVSVTSINERMNEYVNNLNGITLERKLVLRRVHGLRHRCATNVYNLTSDPYAVKHQMRHADIVIGQRYIHAEASKFDGISNAL